MDLRQKKYLKRQESHVSQDDRPYRKDERRLTQIASFKELLDVVAGEQTISHLITLAVLYEGKWPLLPKNESDANSMGVDLLLELVETLDKERSNLSKMASKTTERSETALQLKETVEDYLSRCPVLNTAVALRLASKWSDQSSNTIKTCPLNKKGAPSAASDILLFLGYDAQYESRQFNTASTR